MASMNWDRAKERDVRRSEQRTERESVGNEKSITAKFDGVCITCSKPFGAGDKIASEMIAQKRSYSHAACLYKHTQSEDPTEPPNSKAKQGRCAALTKQGQPCRGGAKKGEIYCGPHLDQQILSPTRQVVFDDGSDPF